MDTLQTALFPLQLVLLPGEETRLHIFEERYRQLVSDWEETGMQFGIPYVHNGMLSGYGIIVSITDLLKKNPDGTSDIEIRAEKGFRLLQYSRKFGEKPYPGGSVSPIDHSSEPVSEDVFKALQKFIQTYQPERFEEVLNPRLNAYDVGRMIRLNDQEKLSILKNSDRRKLDSVLLNHFKFTEALEAQKNSRWGNIILN